MGLEELDASAYLPKKEGVPSASVDEPIESHAKPSKSKSKKRKVEESPSPIVDEPQEEIQADKKKQSKKKKIQAAEKSTPVLADVMTTKDSWGPISLPSCIVSTLQSMEFHQPTPIQASSMDIIRKGQVDVVGVAETGSGKTLAFGLPIIEYILNNYDTLVSSSPHALIITPTRELALQITSVLKDLAMKIAQTLIGNLPALDANKSQKLINIGKYSALFLILWHLMNMGD